MKTQISLILILPLLAISAPLAAQDHLPDSIFWSGRIRMQEVYDFGSVPQGVFEGDVPIRNVGSGPLRITAIKSSCGCMVGMIDREIIPPGDSALLHIKISATHARGMFRKSMTILSSDTSRSTHFLLVQADVYTLLEMEPDQTWLYFDLLRPGVDTARTIRLINRSGEPLIPSPPELLDVSPEGVLQIGSTGAQRLAPDESCEITITCRPTGGGQIRGSLVLKGSGRENVERRIEIFGRVAEPQE